MAYELSERLAKSGKRAPDLAFAGVFSAEDHVFKALAKYSETLYTEVDTSQNCNPLWTHRADCAFPCAF